MKQAMAAAPPCTCGTARCATATAWGGKTYTGTRLRAFGRNHSSEAEALQELAPFITPGQAVKVYYDPAKPSVSVLIPG